jgi:TRAP-type mannitol/chloroaromatic compound transport system permease small subunit
MKPLLRLSAAIDRLTDRVGRIVSWLVVLMVVIASYNAVARYLGRFIGRNFSSNAYIEMQWYLFSIVFLLCAGWVLKDEAHVRVDVLYGRVTDRTRAWINLLGGIFLLFPFCIFVLWASYPSVRNSWIAREVSADPGGLARYPLKAMILVGFVLLLVQAISEMIKAILFLRHVPEAHVTGEHHPEGV